MTRVNKKGEKVPRVLVRDVRKQPRQFLSTEAEVFLDKKVRETRQTAGANSRRGASKKREISRTLLSINLHFSVVKRGRIGRI